MEGTTKVPCFVVSTSYTTTGSSTYCPRRTSSFRVGDASANGFVCESVIVRTVCITVTVCVDLLTGQVYSLERAGTLGILPGSIGIVKSLLPEIHVDLIFGLSLFEGCTPVDYLKPHQHHFTHYSDGTRIFGPLSILWMNGFERFNKFLKGLVNNAHHAEMNMARFVTQTGAANFFSLLKQKVDLPGEMCHRCVSVSVSVNNLC